jgi:hypothetical protein
VDSNLGNYNAAHTNYKKAVEMYRHLHSENAKNADLAGILNNLGNVDSNFGECISIAFVFFPQWSNHLMNK